MATKRTNEPTKRPLQRTVSRAAAKAKLGEQIEKGSELRNQTIQTEQDLRDVRSKYHRWSDFNEQLLSQYFDDATGLIRRYRGIGVAFVGGQEPPLANRVEELKDDIDTKINRLQSLSEQVNIIPEPPTT